MILKEIEDRNCAAIAGAERIDGRAWVIEGKPQSCPFYTADYSRSVNVVKWQNKWHVFCGIGFKRKSKKNAESKAPRGADVQGTRRELNIEERKALQSDGCTS